jgi:LysR family hydrogen peroxide-inducible transcriptional activator
MNFQQLEYIVALDTYKSFSKAAESCFITQATLSTMVKKLEEELDIVIFDRKNNPIITTDCGKYIVEEAKKVLFHSKQLKYISSEIKNKIEGELKIGIIPTVASSLLHRILPSLLEKYPLLKLRIQEITTSNIISQLKTGELDVGIVSTPLKNEVLEEEILYYEKLLVYGNTEYSNTKYLSPKDIIDEDIWLLEEGNCLTDQIINVCSLNPKKINSNLIFSPNSFETLINIVDKLKGLTLIPELFYNDLSEERKKNIKDFSSPFPVREISIVFHRPYAKSRLIEALSQEIREIISPLLDTSNLKNSEMIIAKM